MSDARSAADTPRFRYDAALANEIEVRWQERWAEQKIFEAPNPVGDLSSGFEDFAEREKMFVLDMFPYPSGSGLHVGHPLGYIATDVLARYHRMAGRNVLHSMGYDAFGLPAEQYAVQTGTHPGVTTANNVANMRRQLGRLGLGHDMRRSISTTDVEYYRWTQWIFLQIFESWFDHETNEARPVTELRRELDEGRRSLDNGDDWASLDETGKLRALLDYRLAYVDDATVNWCPALGTVLANEEVTNEGRSERGNHPVFRRPMRQWKMRITSYADRLLEDLDDLDWPESVKQMQRNWIGRSIGARIDFATGPNTPGDHDATITVFTTRPDTLFGATYMVLAPEHHLVDEIVTDDRRDEVRQYVEAAINRSEIDRTNDSRIKTGVFTGAHAVNPANEQPIPIYVADYVLAGYGTGAIMAVPAHDQRDFEFAKRFELPITAVVQPDDTWLAAFGDDPDVWESAFSGDGIAINSANATVALDGLRVREAKQRIVEWLVRNGRGQASVNYKLRDWLFSRQRYWGEPFPIVWDGDLPMGVPESELPVRLPELDDYAPRIVADDDEALPEPPLGRAEEWRDVVLDLGEGPREYRRELNTMPQWAGSCWYYLRYMDPTNDSAFVAPGNEAYWSGGRTGAIDLYVGGVEHAVLHLLYARFWHKVLFDLRHVSTREPFQRLFNQGMIEADAFQDSRGIFVDATAVVENDGVYTYEGNVVTKSVNKMGKSLKNSVNPDDIYRDYGADSLRLYEMAMGPIDAYRPWASQGIVGLYRFLQRLWRNLVDEDTGDVRLCDSVDDATRRLLHKTIDGVDADIVAMRFNTAISKLIELNNHLNKLESNGRPPADRETAETITSMLAPFAPHVAEELWAKLGHEESLTWHRFPKADPALLVDETIELPVQVQGKVRARLVVPADLAPADVERAALAEPNVQRHLDGRTVVKVVVVPGKTVNIVISR